MLGNGTQESDGKIYELDSRKYLDVSDLADYLDADIKWLPVSKKVTLAFNGRKLEFSYFSSKVKINDQIIKMPATCRLEKGDLFVPLEFIVSRSFSRAIGIAISYDAAKKTLNFYDFPNITALKVQPGKDSNRLILETKQKLYYEAGKSADNKITINIYKGVLDPKRLYAGYNDPLVTGLVLKQDRNKVEWTIEACPEFEYNVEVASNPWRIIVDIKKTGGPVCLPQPEITIAPSTGTLTAVSTGTITVMAPLPPSPEVGPVPPVVPEIKEGPPRQAGPKTKIKTIVIDAGHGGKDPGAVGPHGIREKDINLELAFKLAEMLHEKTNLNVILTRKEDEFIPLAERTQIANDKKADLFVCIHCNSGLERDAKGFEIYFLSDRASDQEAEAVANIENSVIDLEDKSAVDDKLKAILWSLTLNEFVNDSSELASMITNRVNDEELDIVNRGVKQAGFFVLRGAKMPAVLAECAFLSNKREERLLSKDSFQDKIVEALFYGIIDYIDRKEEK